MSNSEPALWVLHGDNDGRPAIAGWAKTEADANAQLATLRAAEAQNTFWAETLDAERVAYFKQGGLLPEDA